MKTYVQSFIQKVMINVNGRYYDQCSCPDTCISIRILLKYGHIFRSFLSFLVSLKTAGICLTAHVKMQQWWGSFRGVVAFGGGSLSVFATQWQILSLPSEVWFFQHVTVLCGSITNFHISGLSANTEAHCPIFCLRGIMYQFHLGVGLFSVFCFF